MANELTPNIKNEIILYQPNDSIKLEVRLADETVWLTQTQIADLFGTQRPAITKHLNNIFKSGELSEDVVCSILKLTTQHGAIAGKTQIQRVKFYNLDAIISVGYRVNSINATLFRIWATKTLKEYLLHGYAINQRFIQIENRLAKHDEQIDFFVKTALPSVEGVFYDGQIFDAYKFVSDLVETAKKEIYVIDNKEKPNIHDRFLLVDNDLYHIGASLKDLGKKLFAFSKMEMQASKLLTNIIAKNMT
jgi:hypothetical protein